MNGDGTETRGEVTQLLRRWSRGDEAAGESVLPIVYSELHRIAAGYLSRERRGHTLQTTALIHEAYLRLCQGTQVQWNDRAHFFALMSQVMRRVLINHARDRKRLKRGGDAERVSLDESGVIGHARDLDLEALEDALSDLESADPMKAAIVELRFYGGLTLEETAQHLRISKATVVRHWRLARAWLYHELDVE